MLQIPVGDHQKKIIIHPINKFSLSLRILALQPLRLFTLTLFTAKVILMISIYLFLFKTFIFELLMALTKKITLDPEWRIHQGRSGYDNLETFKLEMLNVILPFFLGFILGNCSLGICLNSSSINLIICQLNLAPLTDVQTHLIQYNRTTQAIYHELGKLHSHFPCCILSYS